MILISFHSVTEVGAQCVIHGQKLTELNAQHLNVFKAHRLPSVRVGDDRDSVFKE